MSLFVLIICFSLLFIFLEEGKYFRFLAIIVVVVVLFVSEVKYQQNTPIEREVVQQTPIVALQDNAWTNIQWGWFIFTSITSEWAQRYYYAVDRWWYYTVEYIEGFWDQIRIHERAGNFVPSVERLCSVWHFRYLRRSECRYNIHIPKWSVKQDYNIDLN